MICWSIGTLAYSIVFVAYGVVPQIIGGLGIVASILVGLGNATQLMVWKREGDVVLVKPRYKVLAIGGLSAIVFEAVLGGWLLFYSII
jgi:hypothetical protein